MCRRIIFCLQAAPLTDCPRLSELTQRLILPKNTKTHIGKITIRSVILFALPLSLAFLIAPEAHAGFFDNVDNLVKNFFPTSTVGDHKYNASNVPLPAAIAAVGQSGALEDYMISDGGALLAASGPGGAAAELTDLQAQTAAGAISAYIVQADDTISSIADKYGISADTINWANGLNRKSKLKVGQTLVILPITSVQHKVVKGDTIAKIAKRYSGDVDEIIAYNGLEDGTLTVGETVIIPDGEMPALPLPPKVAGRVKYNHDSGPDLGDYYISPVLGCRKTQGIHGHNGVDLGCPMGTPLRAAAAGTVIVASSGGWGGGYGNYVVIRHPNGTQTVYAHMLRVSVRPRDTVGRGESIGTTGNSGKSTGPHVHFEVRGARNPF